MVLAFIRSHFFIFALLGTLITGFLAPQQVLRLESVPGFRGALVASVLFLMGLTVPTRAFKSVVRSPMAGILAIGLNTILVPALAALASLGLTSELGGGLIVAASAPCTLASAIVWTRRGGGDEAVAMLVTVVTNFFCFLIAPVTLLIFLGTAVPINFSDQATKLGMLVVLPLLAAQLVRQNQSIGNWTIHRKKTLTNISLAGILTMVALGAAHSVPNSLESPTAISSTSALLALVPMVLAAVAVHCGALAAGWFMAKKLGLRRPQQTAVAIAGSQKTLMVGLQLAIDCSVSTVPMVAYHLSQLLIDTVFASKVAGSAVGTGDQSDDPKKDD